MLRNIQRNIQRHSHVREMLIRILRIYIIVACLTTMFHKPSGLNAVERLIQRHLSERPFRLY